jgi:hypothetical protein
VARAERSLADVRNRSVMAAVRHRGVRFELQLLYLAWTLDRAHTQEHHAGKSGIQLLKLCRTGLGQLPELEPAGTTVLTRIADLLEKRHDVVHTSGRHEGRGSPMGTGRCRSPSGSPTLHGSATA